MSIYSSQLSYRLRGLIDNDINTVPLSEQFTGNIVAADSKTNRIVITGFNEKQIDSVQAGDFLFIRELEQALKIEGITPQAGLTKKIIYVQGDFASLPTIDDPIEICRIASAGINRPQALTVTNKGGADIVLDGNPDAIIAPGENYSIWGGTKTIVPVVVNATGTIAQFSDGENSIDLGGAALPPATPNPDLKTGYELRPFYLSTGDLVFREAKVGEDGSVVEQWYEISGGSLATITAPTNLAGDISVSKTIGTMKYGIAGDAGGDFPLIASNVLAGASYVAFLNIGTTNATVNGVPLLPNEFVDFPSIPNGVYKLIPYDGTGTTLKIQEIRF